MSNLNRTNLKDKFNNVSTGLYKTGQSRGIGSDDQRTHVEDFADSHFNLEDDAYTGAKSTKPGISATVANAITTIKAIVTVNMTVGVFIMQRITNSSNQLRVYELVAGTSADSGIHTIRPTDYAASTNEKVWIRCTNIYDDYTVPNLETVLDSGGGDAGGFPITGLPAPSTGDSPATKTYVDAAISAGDTLIYEATISSSDILASKYTPKLLIAAPGSGYAIMVLSPPWASMTYNSTTYISDGNLELALGGGVIVADFGTFFTQNQNAFSQGAMVTGNQLAKHIGSIDNQGLYLQCDGSANPTTGNSTIKLRIAYKIVTT